MIHPFQVFSVSLRCLLTLPLCILRPNVSLPFKLISGFLSSSWHLPRQLLCLFRETEKQVSLLDKEHIVQTCPRNTQRGLLADIQRGNMSQVCQYSHCRVGLTSWMQIVRINPPLAIYFLDMEHGVPGPGEYQAKKQKCYCRLLARELPMDHCSLRRSKQDDFKGNVAVGNHVTEVISHTRQLLGTRQHS